MEQGYKPVEQPPQDFNSVTNKQAQDTQDGVSITANDLPGINETTEKPDPLQTSSVDPYVGQEQPDPPQDINVAPEQPTEPEKKAEPLDFTYTDPVDQSIKTLPEEYHSITDKKIVDDIKQKFIHERINATAMPYLDKTLKQLQEADKAKLELQKQIDEYQKKEKQEDIYKKLSKAELLNHLVKKYQISKNDLDAWLDDDNNLEVGDEQTRRAVRNKRDSWHKNFEELTANAQKDFKIAELEKKLENQERLQKQMAEQKKLNDQQQIFNRIDVELNNNELARKVQDQVDKVYEPGRFFNEILLVGQSYAKKGISIEPKEAIEVVLKKKYKHFTDQFSQKQDKKMLFPPTQQTNGAYVGDDKNQLGFNVFEHAKQQTAHNFGGMQ